MKRVFIIGAIAGLILAAALLAAPSLRQRFGELQSDVGRIRGDSGDVMASATYQRFQSRREAIIAMREDLRRFASAESAFIADSGYPTSMLPQSYGFRAAPSSIGPTIQIKRDRWIGTMTSPRTTMMCQVTSLFDSVRERFGPGEVSCLGESAADSAWAAAQQEAAPAPQPMPAPPPPIALAREQEQEPVPPTPRRHRDWGPVNNKPPPTPWVHKNECPGEYCAFGRWVACSTVVARRDKREQAPPAFTIQPGEDFTAITGDVHVDVPGLVVFRHPYSNPGNPEGDEVDSIRFTPADTLYVLDAHSEGFLMWYYRGRASLGYQFWIGDPFHPGEAELGDTAVMIRSPQENWWVRVRNRAGQEGWILYDYRRMAQDNRMDELSRCQR